MNFPFASPFRPPAGGTADGKTLRIPGLRRKTGDALACVLLALTLSSVTLPGASLRFELRDADGEEVPDAALWATPAPTPNQSPPPEQEEIDQIDRQFEPHVTIVQTGTAVHFPNNDDIRHHVYSFSDPKRFELPLYTGASANPVEFDEPGIVTLGCNIHDWMLAYVVVVDTPFFAVSDTDGAADIPNLPAGDYIVELWHPRLHADSETIRRELTLSADENASLNFEIDLRPDWRVRRGGRTGGRYR